VQRVDGMVLSLLSDLQRHAHAQGLCAMRRNQNVPGLESPTILVVLHRYAERGKISGYRGESKQIALRIEDGIGEDEL
jgi:hypothetical protein